MKHRAWRKTSFQPTSLIAVALFLLLVFVSVGYFFLLPELDRAAENTAQQETLEAARQKWQELRPLAFRYVVQRECACPEDMQKPYLASEAPGDRQAIPLVRNEDWALVSADDIPAPVWIDELFEIVESSLRDGKTIEVGYDPRFGFPASISLSPDVASAKPDYTVRDFEVLRYN